MYCEADVFKTFSETSYACHTLEWTVNPVHALSVVPFTEVLIQYSSGHQLLHFPGLSSHFQIWNICLGTRAGGSNIGPNVSWHRDIDLGWTCASCPRGGFCSYPRFIDECNHLTGSPGKWQTHHPPTPES